MSLTFGEKIKEARKQERLTQKQLADLIGAAHNSISDWENNKNKPDPDTIELLCGVLKITPNYLLKSSEDDISPKEKQLIKKYRDLDAHGKKMVDFTLNEEWERSKEIHKVESAPLYSYQPVQGSMVAEGVDSYGISAAHERTDIAVTDEMRQHDDNIMDDENF